MMNRPPVLCARHQTTLGPGTSSGLEHDARAAADHDYGLSGQFGFGL